MPSIENDNSQNSSSKGSKPYPPGIHVPTLTFFDATQRQEIDWATQTKHIDFLIKSGLHGVVLAGTNGEAVTLTRSEKSNLVSLTKKLALQNGRPDLCVTLGTSGGCTREVLADCVVAKEAGADFVLVLVPAFFHFAMTHDAICAFFEEVAHESPVPVVIYNFPGVAAGLNVDSTMLDRLAKHPNIVAVKLTCGGIAKVTRVAASYDPSQFSALAGQSDWLVPALSVGGTGCITGVANLYPETCLEIYNLYGTGKIAEAQKLQYKLGISELGFGDGGINGTKWVVGELLGYPEGSRDCRRPYPVFADKSKQKWILNQVRSLELDEARLRGAK